MCDEETQKWVDRHDWWCFSFLLKIPLVPLGGHWERSQRLLFNERRFGGGEIILPQLCQYLRVSKDATSGQAHVY